MLGSVCVESYSAVHEYPFKFSTYPISLSACTASNCTSITSAVVPVFPDASVYRP